MTSAIPLTAGSRVGSYEIVSLLGAGGMGEVWRALDTKLSREIAIKILPPNIAIDPVRLQRFEQEARSASALTHPNIVTIHEIGESDSGRFIAMELVEGETLRQVIGRGALSLRKLLQIATQIADGLAAAHARGIVHRDLKPENVMISTDGFAKILDFGLAKLTEPEIESEATAMKPAVKTSPGQVMGTVGYMSPEQVTAREIDFRSDQFAFGAIVYEMATGKRAFQRDSSAQTMTAIVEDDPAPLQELNPKVPPPLRWVIERCLEKEPNNRYASTHDLARDLHTIREHLSEASSSGIFMAELTAGKRLPRWGVLAAGAIAALVLAIAGYAVGARRGVVRSAGVPQFVQVSFQPGRVLSAAFTPDAKTVLFTARRGFDPPQLYLTHLGSPESQHLGPAPGQIFGISTAGEVGLLRPGGILARMPLAGGAPRDFAEHVIAADWAPNGTDLAVVRRSTEGDTLEYPIGHVLHRTPNRLTIPRIAPDGESVAFWYLRDGRWELMLADRAGTTRRIAGSWEGAGALHWDPDGSSLIFSASEKSLYVVLRATLDGTVTTLALPGRSVMVNDVAADGALLVTQATNRTRLYHRRRDNDEVKEVTWLDFGIPAALSADGSTLLFSELGVAGGESARVYLRRDDAASPVLLGEGIANDLAPDGKWVIASTETAPERIVILPTGAGQPEVLDLGTLKNFDSANWFADGNRILLSANESDGPTQLRIYDRAARKWRAIGPRGYFIGARHPISPDGREAIVYSPADNRYALLSLESGAVRELGAIASRDEIAGWALDGRSIHVLRRDKSMIEIARVDIATGARTSMRKLELPSTPAITDAEVIINPTADAYAYAIFEVTADLFTLRFD